jgi:hypothetical protein
MSQESAGSTWACLVRYRDVRIELLGARVVAESEIERLRLLGLIERSTEGTEAVRVTAQLQRESSGRSREEWRAVLDAWVADLGHTVSAAGGELVPQSFSPSGQLVEALVPIEALGELRTTLAAQEVRLDIVQVRDINR